MGSRIEINGCLGRMKGLIRQILFRVNELLVIEGFWPFKTWGVPSQGRNFLLVRE